MPVPAVAARVNPLRGTGDARSGPGQVFPAWPRNTGKVGGCGTGDGATFPRCSATSRSYHESIGAPDPDRRRSRPRAAPPAPGAGPGPLRREDLRPGQDRAQPHAARQGRLALGRPRLLPRLPQPHPHARRLLDRRRREVPGRHPGRDPPLPDRGGSRQRDPCRPRRLGPDRGPRHRARPSAARAQGAWTTPPPTGTSPAPTRRRPRPPRRGSRWR